MKTGKFWEKRIWMSGGVPWKFGVLCGIMKKNSSGFEILFRNCLTLILRSFSSLVYKGK